MKRILLALSIASLAGCAALRLPGVGKPQPVGRLSIFAAAAPGRRMGATLSGGSEVGSFPNAAPLNGSERILADQSASTVNLTPAQIAQYLGIPNGLTLPISIANGGTGSGTAAGAMTNLLPTYVANDCLANNGSALEWLTCGGGSSTTFQVNGTNLTSSATVNFQNSAATNGLTLGFANPSAGNVQLTLSGTLANAGLANSSLTVNGQAISLGSSGNVNAGAAQYSIALNGAAGSAIGGVTLPASTGTYCLDYSSLTANPTLAACPGGGAGTVNSGASGDLAYYAATGTAVSQLALGNNLTITSGTLNLTQTNRTVTGTTDTISCTTDDGSLVIYDSASAVAVTVPQATGSCGNQWGFTAINIGAGAVTFTPTTSTVNGMATLVLPQYGSSSFISNGTNYVAPGCTACTMPAVNAAAAGISVTPQCSYNNEITSVTSTAYTISAPTIGTATATTGTGSLAAGTYYYVVTATTASGETVKSSEVSATLSATGEIAVTWTAVTGATGYKVYRGTATGAENVYYAVSGGSSASYTDTGATSTSGSPPAANTSGQFTFNAPTGCTPVEGQKIQVNVTSASGGTLTYTENATYLASSSLAFPSASTAASTQDDFLFQYSTALSKWKFMTMNQGF